MKPAATAGRAARAGALGFTVLALVLTALTAWLLSRVFGQGQYANEPLQNVVVAARDLPATEPINEDDLKIVPWPTSAVPKSAFQRKDQVLGPNARVPNALIFAGEPLLSERLASGKTGTGMAAKVPPNLRAFAVRIDAWIAQARLVYPGAVVDVVGTLKDPIDRSPVTRTVLQRLSVVAVDGNIDVVTPKDGSGEDGGRQERTAVVTVLVSPAESEILALASREGKIDIVLRNQNDDDTVETWGTNPYAILGRPNPADVLANAAALVGGAAAPGGAAMAARPAPTQAEAAQPVRRPSSAEIRRAIQADAAASDAAARGSKTINLEAK